MVTSRRLACFAAGALSALLAVSVAVAMPAGAQVRKPFDHAALAKAALEKHIRPGYARLAESAAAAVLVIDRNCNSTEQRERKALEAGFDRLVSAWGQIEHVRFGPITRDNRLERIFFWPDRRGIGARQLARAVARQDESLAAAGALARKSVALQGLTALEYVLFADTGWRSLQAGERGYRCRLALAIAQNVATMSSAVADEWMSADGFSRRWLQPGGGNPDFVLASETTLALAKAMGEGLERVRDDRIGGPMGLNADRRRMPVVLGRSDRSMLLVRSNVEGMRNLFKDGGIAATALATKYKSRTFSAAASVKLINQELETALRAARLLAAIPKPFESEKATGRLVAMGFPLKNVRMQSVTLLTLTAGLAFGFNSSDGD